MRRLSGAYNVTTGDAARGRGRKICASKGDSTKVSNGYIITFAFRILQISIAF